MANGVGGFCEVGVLGDRWVGMVCFGGWMYWKERWDSPLMWAYGDGRAGNGGEGRGVVKVMRRVSGRLRLLG